MRDYKFTNEQKDFMSKPIDHKNPVMVYCDDEGDNYRGKCYPIVFNPDGSIIVVNVESDEEYRNTGNIRKIECYETWRPIPQPKTRPMTKDEILQLINDCPNIWIKDYNNYPSKIMQLDIEDDEDSVKLADVWYSTKELLSFIYSLTLLGEYKRFEVVE